jgi:hypothetical protein
MNSLTFAFIIKAFLGLLGIIAVALMLYAGFLWMTAGGKEIMIPNEEFIINKVTNWTYSNNRARIEISLGVAHGSNMEKTREIMMECAKEHPRCLTYPLWFAGFSYDH